jgi:hypothetical protein
VGNGVPRIGRPGRTAYLVWAEFSPGTISYRQWSPQFVNIGHGIAMCLQDFADPRSDGRRGCNVIG